jgi:hypothetical protein
VIEREEDGSMGEGLIVFESLEEWWKREMCGCVLCDGYCCSL